MVCNITRTSSLDSSYNFKAFMTSSLTKEILHISVTWTNIFIFQTMFGTSMFNLVSSFLFMGGEHGALYFHRRGGGDTTFGPAIDAFGVFFFLEYVKNYLFLIISLGFSSI
jgi:hypothetical protein